jgi:predicted peroxiredoxin
VHRHSSWQLRVERLSEKKILYVQTSGVETPERVYAPLILAIDAAATGTSVTVYFFLKGVTIMKKGEPEKIKLEGYPPLHQLINQAVLSGVKLEVCEQSCMLYGLKKQNLIDHVEVVGSSTLNDHILNADAVLSF